MAKERILVIEDEEDLVEVMSYNLRREGFEVRSASNGAEGLRKARQHGADVILLDLMLPDIDGLEICRRLRRDPLTQRVPVIMVTAKGEESDIVLGLGSDRSGVAQVKTTIPNDTCLTGVVAFTQHACDDSARNSTVTSNGVRIAIGYQ